MYNGGRIFYIFTNSIPNISALLMRKPVDCPLQVGNASLPQVKKFKYLGVLFTSEGTMERETGQRIGAAGVVPLLQKENSARRQSS